MSQPRLATVPYAILSFSTPNTSPGELDPEDMRHVTTRSGVQVWIIPGGRGMCLAIVRPQPREPYHLPGSGAAEVCSANLTQSESDGVGLSSGEPGGVQTLYEIVPIGKTVTIRTRRGVRKTFYPPDGIYVGPNGRPRH